jgi:hypothetical protein
MLARSPVALEAVAVEDAREDVAIHELALSARHLRAKHSFRQGAWRDVSGDADAVASVQPR